MKVEKKIVANALMRVSEVIEERRGVDLLSISSNRPWSSRNRANTDLLFGQHSVGWEAVSSALDTTSMPTPYFFHEVDVCCYELFASVLGLPLLRTGSIMFQML